MVGLGVVFRDHGGLRRLLPPSLPSSSKSGWSYSTSSGWSSTSSGWSYSTSSAWSPYLTWPASPGYPPLSSLSTSPTSSTCSLRYASTTSIRVSHAIYLHSYCLKYTISHLVKNRCRLFSAGIQMLLRFTPQGKAN